MEFFEAITIPVDPIIATQMSNRFTRRAEGERLQRCPVQEDPPPIPRANLECYRPSDLQLAIDYLGTIKTRFVDRPDVVQRFFETMYAFKDCQ